MNFVAIVSILLTVVTVFILVRGWRTRRIEPMGFHTIFLYGMIHFFYIALGVMPWLGYPRNLYEPEGWGWVAMGFMLLLFFAIYMLAHRLAQKWTWPERWTPKMAYPVTTNALVTMLVVSIGITLMLYAALPGGAADYGELLVLQFRPGMGAIMAGFATALLMSNLRNPFYWAILLAIVPLALVISTVQGADRRFPMSVIMVVAFVAYFLRARYWPTPKLFTVVGIGMVATAVFVIVYSSFRHSIFQTEADIVLRTQTLTNALSDVDSGMLGKAVESVFIQDAPLISCYLIENYPSRFPLLPFNGPATFIVMPIPRTIWPDKPIGFGGVVQAQLGVAANLAPGIIGTGWAEMWLFGVAYYAFFFGAFCAVMDRLLRNRAANPYFVVAVGASLGNIVGLPRGEVFMFLSQWATIAFIAWFLSWVTYTVTKSYMAAGRPIDFGPPPGEPNPQAQWDAEASGRPATEFQEHVAHDHDSLIDPELAQTYGHDDDPSHDAPPNARAASTA
jgi:hypothetical protein